MPTGRVLAGPLLMMACLLLGAMPDVTPARDASSVDDVRPPPRLILDEVTIAREHEAYVASVAGMRLYRVRYIRLADEATARDWIARIRSGADFIEIARRHSLHEESAASGGDLGIHASCRWAKATIQILDSLAAGQIHPKPVKGTHGWGIYRLESRIDVVPRSLARYRDELLSGRFEPECPWTPPVTVGVGK